MNPQAFHQALSIYQHNQTMNNIMGMNQFLMSKRLAEIAYSLQPYAPFQQNPTFTKSVQNMAPSSVRVGYIPVTTPLVEVKQESDIPTQIMKEGESEKKVILKEEGLKEDVPMVNGSKKIKKTNTCGHNDQDHYAKNKCYDCYHKYGRTKKPWKCSHEILYAKGYCHLCYIELLNRRRKRNGFKTIRPFQCAPSA
jgi:hypothetical protein